jgi:antitoxin VapB
LRGSEIQVVQEVYSIVLYTVRPNLSSFANQEKADPVFMVEREDAVSNEGRVNL